MTAPSPLWRPGALRPMLAERVDEPFDSPEFLFEVKWDGYRCLAFVAGEVMLQSRNGRDLTALFPELTGLSAGLAPRPSPGGNSDRRAILDGEIVAWRDGRPDFGTLQQRARLRDARLIRAGAAARPVTLVVFDLLHLDGTDLIDRPCEERRRLLAELLRAAPATLGEGQGATGATAAAQGPPWSFSEAVVATGRDLFAAAARAGLEGIMAKRRTSPYRPGQRSADWLKVPVERALLCVIGGATPGGHYGIGALLLGAYDPQRPGRLTYLGHVGTGFGRRELTALVGRLRATAECPFHEVPRSYAAATWVRPDLVCRVGYRELTRDRRLRHPVYRGLVQADPRQCLVPWAGPGGDDIGVDDGDDG